MTEALFGDFELRWEWRVSPGGNSGIKYNVSEPLSTAIQPRNAAKGFEYQILDDDRHPDGKLESHRAGALYDLLPPGGRKRLRPVGEWNESRIVFRAGHGEHWLNGEKVVEYDLGTPPMAAALAASKYRDWAWFAERRRTPIVLQDHNDAVWFRGLKIRELTGATTGSRIEHDSAVAVRQPGPHQGGGETTAYPFFSQVADLPLVFRKRALHRGAAIGYHPHEAEGDEIYYVLSGRGEFTLDGVKHAVGPGSAMLTRRGSAHGLRQTGDADLVILVAYPRHERR
jgi:quercetin dioxygenase-like cupin family protein